MFSCVMCEKEWCYVSSFCPSCRIIKNIGNSYGFEEIRMVLEKVCLRNKIQRDYKINKQLKNELIEKTKALKTENNEID